MTDVTPQSPTSKAGTIAIWVLRVLMAALFAFAAFMKLSGNPMMVTEFGHIGLGQGFRVLTGIMELVGAVAVLVPRLSVLGALLLLAIDLGAFVAQATKLHGDVIHTIVIGAILATLIYLQRNRWSFPKRLS